MAMHEYFEDINNFIKERGCVTELIAMEAMKLTQRISGSSERKIDPDLLHVLTMVVVSKLDIEEIKAEFQQRARRRDVNQQIDASIQRKKKKED